MTGQRGLIVGVVAILLGASGCVSCGHQCYGLAREASPDCDLPDCQRNQVYIFAMSSLNPLNMIALDDLCEQLNRHGYAKVATGQTIHSGWMAKQMRQIHTDHPDAVFVIVGFESAGSTAAKLAETVSAEGIPVSGVVILDSEGKTSAPMGNFRTLTITATESLANENAETVAVPNTAPYNLPGHARTVAAVTELLNDAAATIPIPATVEVTEWDYPYAPPMRRAGDPTRDPAWSYLFDHGATGVAASKPAPTTATIVATPASNGSGKMPE